MSKSRSRLKKLNLRKNELQAKLDNPPDVWDDHWLVDAATWETQVEFIDKKIDELLPRLKSACDDEYSQETEALVKQARTQAEAAQREIEAALAAITKETGRIDKYRAILDFEDRRELDTLAEACDNLSRFIVSLPQEREQAARRQREIIDLSERRAAGVAPFPIAEALRNSLEAVV